MPLRHVQTEKQHVSHLFTIKPKKTKKDKCLETKKKRKKKKEL